MSHPDLLLFALFGVVVLAVWALALALAVREWCAIFDQVRRARPLHVEPHEAAPGARDE